MKYLVLSSVILLFWGCGKSDPDGLVYRYQDLNVAPEGFPAIVHPEDNAFTLDRWKLGKKLFFDPLLSRDSSLSCASCHHPKLAFSDDKAVSPGVEGRPGTRNSPSLANVAYHPYYTREGGVPTLEMQVLVPVQEHNEMDFNLIEIVNRLELHAPYREMSRKAYDRKLDHFVITRALACFERTLVSGNSNFDRYYYQHVSSAMSAVEQEGMELFFSERTKCASCHEGFNFTNYAFENNGLYEEYHDPGRYRLTGKEADKNLFKVPGLRNIALTAPYMHDGSLRSLEDVVDHYVSGGADHPHKSALIQPLELSEQEKEALIAFLHALTDHQFINNSLYHEEK